jgi:hypothetical protein
MSVDSDITITPSPDDDGEPKRRRWRDYFRRSQPEYSTALAPYSPDDHLPPTALRRWADRHTGHLAKPHPARIKATASYWARTAPKLLVVAVPKIVKGLVAEVVPIVRGAGRVTEAYLRWLSVPSLVAAAAVAEAAGTKSKALLHHHSAKSRRTGTSIIGAAGAIGGGFYLYFVHPWWLAGIGVVLLGVLDAIGRRGQPTKEFVPIPRQPLSDGMPLRQLTESILAVFGELGLTVTAEGVVQWDIERKQYRLGLATFDELTPDHMRGVERGIGAPDDSIRLLRVPETATSKLMVIQYGDPIPVLPSIPDRPTGSLTINDAYTLGESTGDYPFAMHFAGSHVIVVGATGAAKSSVHMCNIIDCMSVSRDVVMWGIDLTRGPLFAMWRDVIQRKAYTPDEANALLDAAIDEMDRRAKVLDDIANDDDPTNDTSEWNTSLGPALVIFIDEFPAVAEYNGTPKDTLNLLEKVERIHRTGRKFLVSLIIGIQKMGNADTGSSVVSSQSGQVIVGPCIMSDTVAVFGKDGRDYGYAPQNLKPGVSKTQLNDAGKAFVKAPGFGPDVVRGYGALAPGEIKRRATKRVADGLPSLGDNDSEMDIDAVIVPPAIGALEAAFKVLGARVPSSLVIEHANNHGGRWTTRTLAAELRKECAALGVAAPSTRSARSELSGNDNVQHYYAEDLAPVLDALE